MQVVNIWSGSKKLIKVVLRQEEPLQMLIHFDPLQMMTTTVYTTFLISV